MKRILVAINEDPIAPQLIETAGKLAQLMGASVTVCHIMPQTVYDGVQENLKWQRYDQPFTYDQAEEQAKATAHAAAEGLQKFNLRWNVRASVGDPAREIVRLAQETSADLIVLGFEGLHGLGRLRALGSVSRAVMEETHLPVLVIPALRAGAKERVKAIKTERVLLHGTKLDFAGKN
jgi:universal stress protein A